MSIRLSSPFVYPLHVASWSRPRGSIDYRVTNPFDGPDFLNGGQHNATDVGNTRVDDLLRSPATCRARGLRHSDGALGVEFDLGSGVVLSLWHLNATLAPIGRWQSLATGQIVGRTGNTGANVWNPTLKRYVPMPAHTHIRAARDGVPFDPEPHLPMVERAAIPIPLPMEDDMQVWGSHPTHIVNRQCRLTVDANFRRQARRTDAERRDTTIAPMPAGKLFIPTLRVVGERIGEAADGRQWYYGTLTQGVDGQTHGCFHSSVLPRTADGQDVELTPIEQVDPVLVTRIERARTAVAGADQALTVAREALA